MTLGFGSTGFDGDTDQRPVHFFDVQMEIAATGTAADELESKREAYRWLDRALREFQIRSAGRAHSFRIHNVDGHLIPDREWVDHPEWVDNDEEDDDDDY